MRSLISQDKSVIMAVCGLHCRGSERVRSLICKCQRLHSRPIKAIISRLNGAIIRNLADIAHLQRFWSIVCGKA